MIWKIDKKMKKKCKNAIEQHGTLKNNVKTMDSPWMIWNIDENWRNAKASIE